MSAVQQVIDKVNDTRETITKTFPKVDPRLVIALVLDRDAKQEQIYTLDIILKLGQNTDTIRQDVVNRTGSAPGFSLNGIRK
jgi:hypothetical protein